MNLKGSFFILALSPLTFVISHVISNGSSCTYDGNSSRTAEYNIIAPQPFILRCPVQFCSQIPPNVTWCKVIDEDTCNPVTPGPRISPDQEKQEKNYTVQILKFHSAQIDDSGLYKCSVINQEEQTVRVIRVRVFDGPRTEPFIPDTSYTWTTYFFIAVRIIMVIVGYALIHHYLGEVKANHRLFRRTFSKIKFVAASRATRRISSKHNPDIDPPTESFETICDDLETCEDELTAVLPHNEETSTDGTLQDSKERIHDQSLKGLTLI